MPSYAAGRPPLSGSIAFSAKADLFPLGTVVPSNATGLPVALEEQSAPSVIYLWTSWHTSDMSLNAFGMHFGQIISPSTQLKSDLLTFTLG